MDIKEQKRRLRQLIEAKRNALSDEERRYKSGLISRRIIDHLDRLHDGGSPFTLFTYVPFRSEVDISPVLEWCWTQGITVVAPTVDKRKRRFTLHIIRSFGDLEAGTWGIPEPKPSTAVWNDDAAIRMMLVPGVAFDRKGGRLGYGGGYYDRFIDVYRSNHASVPYKLAPAFEIQVVPEVPMEEHDMRIDRLITEME